MIGAEEGRNKLEGFLVSDPTRPLLGSQEDAKEEVLAAAAAAVTDPGAGNLPALSHAFGVPTPAAGATGRGRGFELNAVGNPKKRTSGRRKNHPNPTASRERE